MEVLLYRVKRGIKHPLFDYQIYFEVLFLKDEVFAGNYEPTWFEVSIITCTGMDI